MIVVFRVMLLAALVVIVSMPAAEKRVHQAQPPQPMILEKPTGTYHAWSVSFVRMIDELPSRFRGVMRDGQAMIPGPQSLRQNAGSLRLQGNKLTGSFIWQQHIDMKFTYKVAFTGVLDDAGKISGSWVVTDPKGKERKRGDLAGWIRDRHSLAARNALSSSASWTTWSGNDGDFKGYSGERPLIDDLKQARLLWRSEDPVPTGQGNAVPFGRSGRVPYALDRRTIGAGASPVLKDGKIYIYYSQPVAQGPYRRPQIKILADKYHGLTTRAQDKEMLGGVMGRGSTFDEFDGGDEFDDLLDEEEDPEELLQERLKVVPPYAKEKYAIFADDVLVCIDAVTGATLWKATFPAAGVNSQDHKTGPVNLTPCVDAERVYFTNTTGRVYALNKDTGSLLWTAIMPTAGDVATKTPYTGNYHAYDDNFCQNPILVDDLILVPDHQFTLYAFDRRTGKERWRTMNAVGRTVPPEVWRHQGQAYVVTLRKMKDPKDLRETIGTCFQLVRLSDGAIMWTQEGEFSRSMSLAGDTVIVYGVNEEKVRKGPILASHLYAFTLGLNGPTEKWHSVICKGPFLERKNNPVILGDRVIITSSGGYRVLHLQTGETISRLPGVGGGHNAFTMVTQDRLLTRIDGVHGSNSFIWVKNPAGQLERAPGWKDKNGKPTGVWSPPQPTTNSYSSRVMSFFIVDGRFYLRGADGLYCYDVRQPLAQ